MDGNILNGCSVVKCDLMFQGKFGRWGETTWKTLTYTMYCIQYLLSTVPHWSHCLSNITAFLWLRHGLKWRYSTSFSRNISKVINTLKANFQKLLQTCRTIQNCWIRSSSVRIYTLQIVYVLISLKKGHWTLTFHHHFTRKLSIVLTLRLHFNFLFFSAASNSACDHEQDEWFTKWMDT